jgi:RNA polymerase sigma factor (sigma-70 family)
MPSSFHLALLYHFCRMRLPSVQLQLAVFERHLVRAYQLSKAKRTKAGLGAGWDLFLENLYALDWFLASACLEGDTAAWEALFAARANRTDCLLVDALRMRAVRLFPRDEEKQENAVTEFWGYLLAGERDGSVPILGRYDGQRPLVPWLIRVFQNKHLSDLRHGRGVALLPDEDLDERDLPFANGGDERWHEEFRIAAHDWLSALADEEVLILGLRLRYRLSQREVASLLGIHEGNVSKKTSRLRDHCLEVIGERLHQLGWIGNDLSQFVLKEMDSLLLDEPRLGADRLASLLSSRGEKAVPLTLPSPTTARRKN